MLCFSRAMFDAKVILLKCHYPTTNESLIGGIGLQSRQWLVVHSEGELLGAQVTSIFNNEVVGSMHLQIWSSVFCRWFLAAVNDGAETSISWGTLPGVQDTRYRYSTAVSVEHKFAFRIWVREGSRLDQSFFDFVEGLLLFRTPRESGVHACDGVQRSDKFGVPRYEFAITVDESLKTLHPRLVANNFSVSQFRDCFGIRLHALR